MVGGSPEMASLPPAVIGSILEATNDLIKVRMQLKHSSSTPDVVGFSDRSESSKVLKADVH
jgi:hypothetical protein